MTVISSGKLDGHEARGDIAIVKTADGAQVQLRNLWVAPGAPDVRLYVSPRTDGEVDEAATELGKVPDHQTEVTRDLPEHIDPAAVGSVIVHCTVYSVLFGFGTLIPQTTTGDQQ